MRTINPACLCLTETRRRKLLLHESTRLAPTLPPPRIDRFAHIGPTGAEWKAMEVPPWPSILLRSALCGQTYQFLVVVEWGQVECFHAATIFVGVFRSGTGMPD